MQCPWAFRIGSPVMTSYRIKEKGKMCWGGGEQHWVMLASGQSLFSHHPPSAQGVLVSTLFLTL